MPLPGLEVILRANALGLVKAATKSHAKIGTCSAGATNTPLAFGDKGALVAALGTGPLVEAAAHTLDVSGGPVVCVRVAASNVGVNSAVTRTGSGPSNGVALTGTPRDDYDGVLEVVQGGAVTTATFRLSLDGGDTYSLEYATAASVAAFAAATGLTITFAAGTYVAGDEYTWTSAGPTYDAGDLVTAMTALKTTSLAYEFIHVVGAVEAGEDDTETVENFVALAAAVDLKMTEFFNAGRYTFAVLEAPEIPDASFDAAALANFASIRVVAAAGGEELASSLSGAVARRHAAWPLAARLSTLDFHQSAGWVGAGSLPGISSLYRDEFETPTLDDLRLTTLRTFGDYAGFYVTRDQTLAAPGSDFGPLPYLRIMNRACAVVRAAMLPFVNADLRINDEGYIDEKEAVAIEAIVNAKLATALVKGGHASAASMQINRADNLLSTPKLRYRVRVRPRPLVPYLEMDAGLENPLMTVEAA